MRVFINGFDVMKDGKVVDSFSYTRRGNVYEIYNKSGCIYCDNNFLEADRTWEKITNSDNKLRKMFGFEIEYK